MPNARAPELLAVEQAGDPPVAVTWWLIVKWALFARQAKWRIGG
jgi:hypothetical protein